MGQNVSSRAEIERREDPETVFVVPGHMNLTLRQMDVILGAGQQPGVPFRLGAAGAQRPQGNRVKVNYAENLVSLQKNSVRITMCEEDDVAEEQGRGEGSLYAVSFNYDALVPSVVRIFVTASDRTVPHQIRVENAALILGPYKIEGGNNRNWSSTCEHSYIDDKYLTDKLKSKIPSTPDIFSLIICIAPAEMVTRCDLFSIPPGVSARTCKEGGTAWITQKQQQQHAEYKEGMRDSTGDDGSPGSRSVATSSAMKMGGRAASGTAVGASSSGSDDGHKDRDRDPYIAVNDYDFYAEKQADMKLKKKPSTPDLPAPGCASDGQNQNATPKSQFPPPLTQKINSKSVCVHSADVFHSQNYDKLSMVICEVSYVRMVSPKKSESTRTTSSEQHVDSTDQQYNIMTPSAPTSTSAAAAAVSPSSLEVKCVMQRVQMSCGVFLTQDIYGMDRNCVEEEPEPIPDPHNAEDDASGSGDDEVRAPPATTPAGITLDSDAIECVICLTDPRIIAVYPCRHMCLCASCAEVLPSQGNKCPICRRAASMLLKISPKEILEESRL